MSATTLRTPDFYRSTAQHLSEAVAAEPLAQGFSKTATAEWVPPIELHETARTLILTVELPGMADEYLEISLSQDTVEISGERHPEPHSQPDGIYQSELHYGKFQRLISLPILIDPATAKADFRDGMLMLILPKVIGNDWKVMKIDANSANQESPAHQCSLQSSEVDGEASVQCEVGPSYWFA
jgi:HSP20 family protein